VNEEKEAIQRYRVEGRQALVARVAKGASTAIDTLIAAAETGDVRASEIILKKVLPDLKSVDVNNSGDGVKIVINQKIYNRSGKEVKTVELPSVNINISKDKEAKAYKEIDITPSVSVSEPPEQGQVNYREERKKGIIR
jgi:hypothetical protein